MAVLQMKRVSICALKKNRKTILKKLQGLGIMQISNILEEDADFSRMDTSDSVAGFRKMALLADRALKVLDGYAPEKRSFFASLKGKMPIGEKRRDSVLERKEELKEAADRILRLDGNKDAVTVAIIKREDMIRRLTPYLLMAIPMDFCGTAYTSFFLGTMPAGSTKEGIYRCIAETAPSVGTCHIDILDGDRNAVYLAVSCLKKDAGAVEEAIRAAGFERPSFVSGKIPRDYKEELTEEIKKCLARIDRIKKDVASYAKYREDLKIFSDHCRVCADRYEALGTLPQSLRAFVISGYVAAKDVPKLREAIADKVECVMDVDDIKDAEDPPVILKNNRFSSSVEGVLASYGLPKKGEADPTAVMSFFYIILFGLMLSDAAYGLVMFSVCFAVIKKFPKMNRPLQKNIRMFMYCGLSTLAWGILFGSYCGDAIDVVARTYFHANIPEGGLVKALWFVPLNDPMRMLMYSLGFGLVHLFAGLAMKGYMLLKEKKYMDFFCSVVLWYVFLAGLLLMLIPSDIFASIAQLKQGSMPPVLGRIGKITALVGLAGLVLMSAHGKKNIFLRLALGLYEVYNVTGWMSDILSYSRLLALGLATGVIASVVNQMGSMLGDGVISAAVFIFVFIVGHALNMAINLLGAYVHTNRLQYVEFFSKFYEGGGQEFIPFKSNTKYVEIKEETNV